MSGITGAIDTRQWWRAEYSGFEVYRTVMLRADSEKAARKAANQVFRGMLLKIRGRTRHITVTPVPIV